ncbi:DNA phosphorothioation-dependent restriction protein DptF [Vibrio vulnificus]|nr:DNA phosphorothioation-dependent restriction protein DptF [Vibrio vulnificus]EIZ1457144.1 DNA phosphorothioation-dependent restriction protein DptF [Vibrio vulnificus]EJE8568800.1 DNA phosphorothioation-dependent restriction protein DptF [Vibrio vulnificus]ELP6733787.1 DNA phosphorothioation-dependent restriction protein DptF [Vibrio vulnificus]ELX4163650.1 DNA phosphorothioation-dependent restriction protein DptF [Vibrio vulnificus]
MNLAKALSILSKSSPYAVSTEREQNQDHLADYKRYIYIQTDIEADFKKALLSAKPNQIIFLCGSSGDGKSEILTQYSQKHKATHDFHLDATHSFNPSQTAIHALDERFTEFKQSNKPLVVGINVGMLGNYAEEGADDHSDVKNAARSFLARNRSDIPEQYVFLDFEDYPKFTFNSEGSASDFAEQFLKRLTAQTFDNPFYLLYDRELKSQGHTRLTANFALLSRPAVQKSLIGLLLKARLIKDQFLTARALLDFIFQLLAADGYLFDNLFADSDNELLSRIQSFDPSNLHTRTVDEFVLQHSLGIEHEGFTAFKAKINSLGLFEVTEATSFLRLFFVLSGDEELSNGFVSKLQNEFTNNLVDAYASAWLLHRDFDGSGKMRKALSSFYKETLIAALHSYCNRHAPTLNKDEYLVSELNGYKTAVSLEVKVDYTAIQNSALQKIGTFNAYLKVDEQSLKPMPISVKLLELLVKIGQGYRPNKHDKNAVLLLDEALEQMLAVANRKDILFILKANKRYKIVREESDYFEVSGMH